MANSAIHPWEVGKWVVIHVIRYVDCGVKAQRSLKFDTDIQDGPLLRPDHKTTRKWAWPYVAWPNSAVKGRIAYLPADVTSKVNDMFINKNKTANIKGKN